MSGGTGFAALSGLMENIRLRLPFGHKLHLRLRGRSKRLPFGHKLYLGSCTRSERAKPVRATLVNGTRAAAWQARGFKRLSEVCFAFCCILDDRLSGPLGGDKEEGFPQTGSSAAVRRAPLSAAGYQRMVARAAPRGRLAYTLRCQMIALRARTPHGRCYFDPLRCLALTRGRRR